MRALARGCLSKHLQQQGLKRRRRIFHRLGTTCGETPSFRGTHGGLSGNPSRSPSRWNAAHDGRHLGQWTTLSFAGGRGKRSWSEGLAQAGSPAGGLRASGLVRWVRQGCARCVSGKNGSSSRSSHAPATEGVRVTRIGVTNPGGEQSPSGGARGGESRIGPLNQGNPADRTPQGVRLPRTVGHEGNLGKRRHGAREIPVVLVDRGDCRHRRAAPFTGQRELPEGARRRGQAL